MKKNFIQRNIIWISLILLCFTVIPGMREKGYALDKEHENEVSKQSIPTDEKKEEKIKVVIDPGHGGPENRLGPCKNRVFSLENNSHLLYTENQA